MSSLVCHSLVVHMVWLSVHLRVASDLVLRLIVTIFSLLSRRMPLVSSHLTVTALMRSYSAHTVESLTLSLIFLLLLSQSSLDFSFLLSLHSFLLSSQILLPLVIALIKHIANLSKMIDLRVSTVESIILVC